MKRCLLAALALTLVPSAFAVRHVAIGADAFNRAYPLSFAKNLAFSPYSFEIDCVLVAESLPTIQKADISERMGIYVDFASTYRALIDEAQTQTNGYACLAARGFCVPDIQTASAANRQHLEREYGCEVMRSHAPAGAEAWFRATLEGRMEDFRLTHRGIHTDKYSFYDLFALDVAFRDPFPLNNTREILFHLARGTNAVPVMAMSDVRIAETWKRNAYTILRLPLTGDASFYAILPHEKQDLAAVRAELTSERAMSLLSPAMHDAREAPQKGPCAIVLPRLDLSSNLDITGLFRFFRVPLTPLVHVAGQARQGEYRQYARFRLAEANPADTPLLEKPADEVIPLTPDVKKLIFNRPFLFFVYHEKAGVILLVGQFTGLETER